MGDLSDDRNAEIERVMGIYEIFRSRFPDDELTRMISLHEDGSGFDIAPEFWERFDDQEDTSRVATLRAYGRYINAMQARFEGMYDSANRVH